MGREGTSQNNAANDQYMATQTAALNRISGYQNTYDKDFNTLKSGGNIGANPFATPAYLQNENTSAATAAGATADAAKASLTDNALRTGDNSASTTYAIKNNQRTAQRGANTALLGQHAQDYLNNLSWQSGLLGNDLAPAGLSSNVYGTATGGRSGALKNLTDLGIASYGPMNSMIQGLGSAAGGFLQGVGSGSGNGGSAPAGPAFRGAPSGFLGSGCWIAAEIFDGWSDPRTILVRNYLNTEFVKRPIGRLVMAAYWRFGERVAGAVRKHGAVRLALTPLFYRALCSARQWADELIPMLGRPPVFNRSPASC